MPPNPCRPVRARPGNRQQFGGPSSRRSIPLRSRIRPEARGQGRCEGAGAPIGPPCPRVHPRLGVGRKRPEGRSRVSDASPARIMGPRPTASVALRGVCGAAGCAPEPRQLVCPGLDEEAAGRRESVRSRRYAKKTPSCAGRRVSADRAHPRLFPCRRSRFWPNT